MVYALNSTAQLLRAAGENKDWPDGDGTSEREATGTEDETAGVDGNELEGVLPDGAAGAADNDGELGEELTGDAEPPPAQTASPTGVSSM